MPCGPFQKASDTAIASFDECSDVGPNLLKRKGTTALGSFGVGLGLFYSIAVLASNNVGCSCGWNLVQLYYGIPVLIGSIIGLSGILLSRKSQKFGGILLVAGAPVVTPLSGFTGLILSLPPNLIIITNNAVFLSTLLLFYGALALPGLLFLLAGLLTIPKTRRRVKTLLHKISERYYRIPEDLSSPAWR